jgi:indolepyruvate decarboxylase
MEPAYAKTAYVSFETVKYGTYFGAQVSLKDLMEGLLTAKLIPKAQAIANTSVGSPASPSPALSENITYQGFYDFIAGYVTEHTLIGSDASMNYFGCMELKVPTPGGFVAQSSYSSIGYIGPAATGMCLAKRPEQRVMVFSGDGGFQMSAQCLSTQTRFKLNPIIFVIDNGVYAVEQWLADASIFTDKTKRPYESCILHRWDYSKLADVFHCLGRRVETYATLSAAVEDALDNNDSPSIIQVVVPDKSIPTNAKWKKT